MGFSTRILLLLIGVFFLFGVVSQAWSGCFRRFYAGDAPNHRRGGVSDLASEKPAAREAAAPSIHCTEIRFDAVLAPTSSRSTSQFLSGGKRPFCRDFYSGGQASPSVKNLSLEGGRRIARFPFLTGLPPQMFFPALRI